MLMVVHVCCVSLQRPPVCVFSIIGHGRCVTRPLTNEDLFKCVALSSPNPGVPGWPAGLRRCAREPPGGWLPQLLSGRELTRAGCSQLTR